MHMQIVVGILSVLQDSMAIGMKVVLRAMFEVRPDGVDTAGEHPCFEHLRLLYFLTGPLGDLLAPFSYRDRHGELIFLFNCSAFGFSSRGR